MRRRVVAEQDAKEPGMRRREKRKAIMGKGARKSVEQGLREESGLVRQVETFGWDLNQTRTLGPMGKERMERIIPLEKKRPEK